MKWILLLVLVLVIVAVAFAPWQALQTSWVVPPSGEIKIHWHECLSAGGGSVMLTSEQMLFGFTVENGSPFEPLLVTACD